MKGFKNVNAYIYGKGIQKVDIAIKNGKIEQIGNDLDITEIIPCNGLLVPGFIDRHIHGASGYDVMDANFLGDIAKGILQEGTTTFLPTTMTASVKDLQKVISAVKNYKNKGGAKVLGLHLEGPFISKDYIGAQNKEYLLSPSVTAFNQIVKEDKNLIKLITLAPELKGATSLINYLVDNNIKVSIGHSGATFTQVLTAVNSGADSVTHTYNAQSPFRHRDIGVVGGALSLDQLYTELICDFIHVDINAIKLLVKNKPKDKIVLITDSMRSKYLPDGKSELGGQEVIVKNGKATLSDGTLAGSVLKMNVAIKNLVENDIVNITDAIDFATSNPAKSLGIFDKVGSISVGKYADFTILDKDFNVLATIVQGETEYKNENYMF